PPANDNVVGGSSEGEAPPNLQLSAGNTEIAGISAQTKILLRLQVTHHHASNRSHDGQRRHTTFSRSLPASVSKNGDRSEQLSD
ncbi:MAG: hypothetical protein KDJ36_19010, partial [Hyphomicrobiaceae bacterium]|nr:hypothetical protein [Hyphomicrobiaceae bacterium]